MIDVARCYPRHAYSVNSHVYVKCLKNSRTLKLISIGEGSSNNYAYLVVDDKSKDAVIVDPANPPEVAPILKDAIQAGKINLTAIVNTHQ
ncbi:hypothetical protein LB504_011241 [Fusarium proliferatum]|nr:hypothetical protein LB504_011241 [Fusarium proliferatum]